MAISVIMGGFIPFSTVNSADNGSVSPYTADASGFITVTDGRDVAAFMAAGYFINPVLQEKITLISADGAIPVASGIYMITKGTAAALTLAAPTTAQNGLWIQVSSTTAAAHAITATGLLQTGAAAVNVATMAANAGASVTLQAYNGKWIAVGSTAITFS